MVVFRKRFRRRKRKAPSPVIDALAGALQQLGLTDQARRLRISNAWADAVGDEIASSTRVHGFSRGVLTLKSATAAWQNELTFLKPQLIAKVNESLGRQIVRDIRVFGGRLPARSAPPPSPPSPTAEDVAAAQSAALAIDDPDTREAFARLMAKDRAHHLRRS